VIAIFLHTIRKPIPLALLSVAFVLSILEWVKPNRPNQVEETKLPKNELFDPQLFRIQNIAASIRYCDSIYGNSQLKETDTATYVNLVSRFIKNRFYHGYSNFSFGYNTIGNWSDSRLCKEANLPYVYPMTGFPSTRKSVFRDFPDVFDPTFEDSARKFARQLELLKNDRYLIGYFLRNEPEWAFGNHNLAAEMLANPWTSFTRTRLKNWLKELYKNDIKNLNQTWSENFSSFDDLDSGTIVVGLEARRALVPFTEMLVDSMVSKVCREVKKVDPNHLNLGLRYAWISSDLCYRAGAWFDVFSLNGYDRLVPAQTKIITQKTGKPVMIGEFHFGALDRGLPASGIVASANTKERGQAIRSYMEEGFARPEVIGIHYFLMYDQPILGRFDGENYNVGLFDICVQPYPELKEEIGKAHKRMYKLARRKQKPYLPVLQKVEPIYY
jgi:hypothetical protein